MNSSARNGIVGVGGAIEIQTSAQIEPSIDTFSSAIGMRAEQGPYSAVPVAMASALGSLLKFRYHNIVLFTKLLCFQRDILDISQDESKSVRPTSRSGHSSGMEIQPCGFS